MTSASSGSCLVDTNILVYAVQTGEQTKSRVAARILRALSAGGVLVLSTQNILEFYSAVTRSKGGKPAILSAGEARTRIDRWLANSLLLTIDEPTVRDAIRAVAEYQLPIFDATLWATARANGLHTIVTEDMPSQPRIEGVRYINPFAPGFELADLGL